uniref:Uncharacterized protein n=1 Tax=Anguilla anguilla TaxID=7936 RepID=A0A0E9SBN8_ANGAN
MGSRSGFCTGQSSFPTPFTTKHVLYVPGDIVMLKQERAFPKLLGKHRIVLNVTLC